MLKGYFDTYKNKKQDSLMDKIRRKVDKILEKDRVEVAEIRNRLKVIRGLKVKIRKRIKIKKKK
jgi:hypothetical protein